MNIRHVIATTTLALTATTGAFAQEATIEPTFSFAQSTVDRAEVVAQARQALAQGKLHEKAQIADFDFQGTLSRAAVHRATLAALASGEVDRIDAEAQPLDGQRLRRDASYFRVAQRGS